jgi:hypothetical protein
MAHATGLRDMPQRISTALTPSAVTKITGTRWAGPMAGS